MALDTMLSAAAATFQQLLDAVHRARGRAQLSHQGRPEAARRLRRLTRKSRGIALVQYADPGSAVAAHAALDGSIFQGRLLHILPARRPPTPPALPVRPQARPPTLALAWVPALPPGHQVSGVLIVAHQGWPCSLLSMELALGGRGCRDRW